MARTIDPARCDVCGYPPERHAVLEARIRDDGIEVTRRVCPPDDRIRPRGSEHRPLGPMSISLGPPQRDERGGFFPVSETPIPSYEDLQRPIPFRRR